MAMCYISLFILFALFIYWMNKSSFFSFGTLPKLYAYLALILKLGAALAIWFIYTYYYTDRVHSDIFKYFDDAVHLFNSTKGDALLRFKIIAGFQNDMEISTILADTSYWDSSSELFFNDNRTMIRIHLALLHLSNGFYFLHLLFFSLLSFIGSISLFHFFRKQTKIPDLVLFVVCCCIPSVLFWASAPLKESITVFGLGLFLYSSHPLNGMKRSSIRCGLIALAVMTLISVKLYVLFALIPGFWFWNSSQSKSKVALWSKFVLIHGLLFLFLISNQIVEALAQKQLEFKKLIELSGANSAINIASFDSFLSLITTLPQAISNVLVQPIYPPNWSLFSLFAAAEHFIFLGLLLLPFIYRKQTSNAEQRLALFCISFVMIGSSIIGLTVPVLGGIVRYKVPLIPFYLIAILTFINFSKIAPKLK